MRSPFPGMDPFLENPAYWLDFHSRFVNCWCEAIADVLPPNYEASLGERVYLVEHDPEARKLGFPDVAVSRAGCCRVQRLTPLRWNGDRESQTGNCMQKVQAHASVRNT